MEANSIPAISGETRGTLPRETMIDSGAFVVWKRGRIVSIKNYADFLQTAPWAKHVSLDVIAGKPGQRTTSEYFEAAASEGWSNFEYFQARGLNTIPVYHYGERIEWLYKMLAETDGIVGIAASSIAIQSACLRWYEQVWHAVGNYNPKFHLFGDITNSAIRNFDWYSVDGSSPIQGSSQGLLPLYFSEPQFTVLILGFLNRRGMAYSRSKQISARDNFADIESYPESVQERFAECALEAIPLCESLMGKPFDLRESWEARAMVSLVSFARVTREYAAQGKVKLFVSAAHKFVLDASDVIDQPFVLMSYDEMKPSKKNPESAKFIALRNFALSQGRLF